MKWENYRNGTHGLKGGGRNRREVGVPQKGIMWDSYHHGNILYVAYINVSILVVTLCQVLRDVTFGWKLDKACIGTLCIVSYNYVSL